MGKEELSISLLNQGRFAVKLMDSGEKVAVKRENLVHDVENTADSMDY